MKTYTFSYLKKTPHTYLVRRPWWNLWGRDSLETEYRWTRHSHNGLSKAEADILIGASQDYWHSPMSTLLLRMMGNEVWMVQVEESSGSNPSTTSEPK